MAIGCWWALKVELDLILSLAPPQSYGNLKCYPIVGDAAREPYYREGGGINTGVYGAKVFSQTHPYPYPYP